MRPFLDEPIYMYFKHQKHTIKNLFFLLYMLINCMLARSAPHMLSIENRFSLHWFFLNVHRQ